MIQKVRIQNFQKFKDLTLEFDSGVNSIVGETDQGKSAVVRALLWVLENKPNGDSFIRHGAKWVSVSLWIDGQVIRRTKGSKGNCYYFNDRVFKAFGNEVPAPISEFLQVSSLGFQRQMDGPFWFNISPGQLSKNLNAIVDLSIIDQVLQELGAEHRKNKAIAADLSEQLVETCAGLTQLDWTRGAYNSLGRIHEFKNRTSVVALSIGGLQSVSLELANADAASGVFEGLKVKSVKYADLVLDYKAVALSESDVTKALKEIRESDTFPTIVSGELPLIFENYKGLQKLIDSLEETVTDLKDHVSGFTLREQEVRKFEQLLKTYKYCPTCKQPLNSNHKKH